MRYNDDQPMDHAVRDRRRRRLRIAWTMACLIGLGFFLPSVEPARGANGLTVPPAGLIVLVLIGFPILAIIPWIPTRFSLCTLLIIMTLVALGLGLIACTATR